MSLTNLIETIVHALYTFKEKLFVYWVKNIST